MSKKENYPIVINKTNIRDLISESQLLREFSVYGCPDVPGKVFGYNPFTKKCIDITDYSGPSSPVPVPTVGEPDGGSITQIFTSVTGLAELLYGIYFDAFNPDEVMECVTENPFMSGLGFILGSTDSGRTVISALPRAIVKVTTAAAGLQPSLQQSQSLETYKLKHKGIFRELGEAFLKVLKKLRRWGGSGIAYAIGGAGMAYGTFNAFYNAQHKKDTQKFLDWALNEIKGDESFDNWKCLGAAMVLSVTLGALGRAGTNGLFKVAGKAVWGTVKAPMKILKALMNSNVTKNLWVKTINLSLKSAKTDKLDLFKLLQDNNLLPSNAKIILDKVDGRGTLKIDGITGNIKIPKDRVPDNLKKFANNDGEIILNISELQRQLSQISSLINKNINDLFQGTAKTFGDSAYRKQLRLFKQALNKYGVLSRQAIKSQAFENSIELIVKMHDEADILATKLSKLERKLINEQATAKSVINNISDSTTLPEFRKVELEILSKNDKSVPDILSEMYPGLKQDAPKAFEDVEKYFENYRAFDQAQKELISQLEVGRVALIDETKLLESVLGKGTGGKDLEQWLSTGAGQKWEKHWNSFDGRAQRILSKLGDNVSTGLKNAFLKFLSNEDLLIVTGGVVSGIIANTVKTKVDNKEELRQIILFLDDQIQQMHNNDELIKYYDDNDNIKTRELLTRLIFKLEGRKKSFKKQTIKSLDEWTNAIKNDQEYIEAVDKYYNRDDEDHILTSTEIKIRTKAIVRGALAPKGMPAKKKAIKQPISKDSDLFSQIPKGQLVGRPPFEVNVGGQKRKVQFLKDSFIIDNKKFKFAKFGADASISSAVNSGNKIQATLSIGILDEKYSLGEPELITLFNKTSNLQEPGKGKSEVNITLGDKTGTIKRVKIQENRGTNIMNKKELMNLISKVINENVGQGYGKYPYNSDRYSEDEPAEDYKEEWKALELECMQDKTRQTAIDIAKVLVNDLELFNDVLDLAGSNQSIGTEILSKLKSIRDRKNV